MSRRTIDIGMDGLQESGVHGNESRHKYHPDVDDIKTSVILHVEDDESDARMVARSLTKASCPARVVRAADGREALEMIDAIAESHAEIPDLVLLDLKLPYASGLDVLIRARSYDVFATIPIVVLTSSDLAADREACLARGCTEYVVKPIDYFAFLTVVKELCIRYIPTGHD